MSRGTQAGKSQDAFYGVCASEVSSELSIDTARGRVTSSDVFPFLSSSTKKEEKVLNSIQTLEMKLSCLHRLANWPDVLRFCPSSGCGMSQCRNKIVEIKM
jgi:purine-nucleoside phosphorylase